MDGHLVPHNLHNLHLVPEDDNNHNIFFIIILKMISPTAGSILSES